MNNEKIFDIVKEYVSGDVDKLSNMVSACNMYDGGLEDYYYYNNDSEFYDIMFPDKEEVARAVYYGGNDYCYTDEYVRLNVYGNCETINCYDYDDMLRDNEDKIIETFVSGLFEDYMWFSNKIDDKDVLEEIKNIILNRDEEN